jgi:hypothetical protein
VSPVRYELGFYIPEDDVLLYLYPILSKLRGVVNDVW